MVGSGRQVVVVRGREGGGEGEGGRCACTTSRPPLGRWILSVEVERGVHTRVGARECVAVPCGLGVCAQISANVCFCLRCGECVHLVCA